MVGDLSMMGMAVNDVCGLSGQTYVHVAVLVSLIMFYLVW